MKSQRHSIDTVLATVEGWLHPKEGWLLYNLAKQCTGRGSIVEIGSWKGKSTICLSRGSLDGSKVPVHAIDPHTGSPEHAREFGEVWTFHDFQRNIESAGVQHIVVPHLAFSTSVAAAFSQAVELIFIDGLHEYEGVKADFDAWFPKVIPGGVIAFHDTTCWPGVRKLVKEEVFRSPHFRKIRFTRSIVYAEKVLQTTAAERAANRLWLRLFLAHAWYDRFRWRLLHNYLDSALTRAVIAYVKSRRHAKALARTG